MIYVQCGSWFCVANLDNSDNQSIPEFSQVCKLIGLGSPKIYVLGVQSFYFDEIVGSIKIFTLPHFPVEYKLNHKIYQNSEISLKL